MILQSIIVPAGKRMTSCRQFSRDAATILLAVCLAVGAGSTLCAGDWAGWRGPHGNGVSSEADVPVRWSNARNVAWKAPLIGYGISSPVVWGDRVIVTASDGVKLANLHVVCLSLADGRELWHQRLWGTAPTRHHGSKSSMASPTPVTDGEHIFAFFGSGDVFCFEMTGELVWQRALADEYGKFENRFAASSSPLLHGDQLLLQCDHYGDSFVIALDKRTGANRWKVDRPECWLSWASPQLVPGARDGEFELIVSGSHKLDAYDPETGEALWTVGGMRRECIPSPVFGNGLIYAVSGPKGPSLAIRPGGRGDVSESHVVWRNTRGAPFVPSAVLVGHHYYLVDDAGIATCLDAKTGKRHWQKRFGGKYTASPVATDERIYFCDESGTTVVIRAQSDEYEEIVRNDVKEPIYASPAISQGRILLRTTRHLFCINGSN